MEDPVIVCIFDALELSSVNKTESVTKTALLLIHQHVFGNGYTIILPSSQQLSIVTSAVTFPGFSFFAIIGGELCILSCSQNLQLYLVLRVHFFGNRGFLFVKGSDRKQNEAMEMHDRRPVVSVEWGTGDKGL